jgi:Rad3-related DNA helicase
MQQDHLKEQILKLGKDMWGPKWEPRANQIETVIDIIDTYQSGEYDGYICEAPTGTGKSIIAMLFAKWAEGMKKTGYILTSEKILQDQYEAEFESTDVNWGSIRGVDNYSCYVNGQPYALGDCNIKGMSIQTKKTLPCWHICSYLQDREKAATSNVSLMNYNYALIQRIYVSRKDQENLVFDIRDWVICDEGHRLPSIIQNHFSPKLDLNNLKDLRKLVTFLRNEGFINQSDDPYGKIEFIWGLIREEWRNEKLIRLFGDLVKTLTYISNASNEIHNVGTNKWGEWSEWPKEWRESLKLRDICKDMYYKWSDYVQIVWKSGSWSIAKTQDENSIVCNCLADNVIMNNLFIPAFGFKIILSATIGDLEAFGNLIGLKNPRYKKIDSPWDFSRSPIYIRDGKAFNRKNISNQIRDLVKEIENCLDKHKDQNGVIHTGSYYLTEEIWKHIGKEYQSRIKLYDGSFEKKEVVYEQKNDKNSVIMGPSLLEGIDMIDDMSRFTIFAKIPFPNLGNRYIALKTKKNPQWYNWVTLINLIQGIGRSIRGQNDWAVTYILDPAGKRVLKDKNTPQWILNRIKNY